MRSPASQGPEGLVDDLPLSDHFEIRSQGLAWRRRQGRVLRILTASGNRDSGTYTGPRPLRPGQACLTGRLRSLRDSRWCSGSQGRAVLRLRLRLELGPGR